MSTCSENNPRPDENEWNPHIEGLKWERDYWRRRASRLLAARNRLAADNARLRRAVRAKKAFELAIVCLMRRLKSHDPYRLLAGKLVDRYGYNSSPTRRQTMIKDNQDHED
jgi:hypothetical protein